ncbi:hypothetical protein KJK34_00260 [Flavobacterium sp. D11R37]|uniref:hypothetical protein n=1 Tax=Flavobacterium coralii TaxID=2838017 RepID=UPI001CA767CF|nr:hypothetical protein [Flavobacterium coralii]MBY8961175.1 hypothetical protein [Flavobacterium coralii]
MKKLFLKIYVIVFLLAGDFIMFAQIGSGGTGDGTGSDDGSGNNEGDDVPVNGKLIILAITAVAFAFHYYKKLSQNKELSK